MPASQAKGPFAPNLTRGVAVASVICLVNTDCDQCNREWPCNHCQKRRVADRCQFKENAVAIEKTQQNIGKKRERDVDDGDDHEDYAEDVDGEVDAQDVEGFEALGYAHSHLFNAGLIVDPEVGPDLKLVPTQNSSDLVCVAQIQAQPKDVLGRPQLVFSA